jgi:hypothetical protein
LWFAALLADGFGPPHVLRKLDRIGDTVFAAHKVKPKRSFSPGDRGFGRQQVGIPSNEPPPPNQKFQPRVPAPATEPTGARGRDPQVKANDWLPPSSSAQNSLTAPPVMPAVGRHDQAVLRGAPPTKPCTSTPERGPTPAS